MINISIIMNINIETAAKLTAIMKFGPLINVNNKYSIDSSITTKRINKSSTIVPESISSSVILRYLDYTHILLFDPYESAVRSDQKFDIVALFYTHSFGFAA